MNNWQIKTSLFLNYFVFAISGKIGSALNEIENFDVYLQFFTINRNYNYQISLKI